VRPSPAPAAPRRAAAPARRASRARASVDLVKGYLLLGGGFVFLAFFIYTNYLIGRLEQESDTLARMFARFCAVATVPAAQNEQVKDIFSEVMREAQYPVVVTDARGVPWTWKGIGVDLSDVPFEVFTSTDPKRPHDPRMREVLDIVDKMDSKHVPIAMLRPGDAAAMGYVHYGDSDLIKQLKWVPFVQAGVVATFLVVVLFGYRSAKLSEQRSIWVGMAKETAHQLGTPISSLMGWVEILRDRASSAGDGRVAMTRDEMLAILTETETDLRRLEKVVSRFSHVGSTPALHRGDLLPVLRSSVDYLRRRFPQLAKEIEIRESYDPVPPIWQNGELLEWVVENLVKNSLDAMAGSGGTIEVAAMYDPAAHRVRVTFRDDGRGMTPAEQRQAFLPGFSSKRRGWGLGLPLSRRIVEEYHNGRLRIVKSAPGEGTLIEASFPIAAAPHDDAARRGASGRAEEESA
jgi:hypothetical protein